MTNNNYNTANKLLQFFFDNDQFQNKILPAYTDPEQYVEQGKDDLIRRGIEKPFPGLFWIALVNGLIKKGRLYELDWKSDAADLYNAVRSMLSPFPKSKEIIAKLDNADVDDDAELEDAITLFNHVLKQFNLALFILDIDSDSYPLTIISTEKSDTLIQLVEELGIGKAILLQ